MLNPVGGSVGGLEGGLLTDAYDYDAAVPYFIAMVLTFEGRDADRYEVLDEMNESITRRYNQVRECSAEEPP